MTPAEEDGEQQQVGELGGEGLGGSNADLGARLQHQRQIGFPHERTGGHVADCQRVLIADVFCDPQCSQRVCGFAGLGDSDEQVVLVTATVR